MKHLLENMQEGLKDSPGLFQGECSQNVKHHYQGSFTFVWYGQERTRLTAIFADTSG